MCLSGTGSQGKQPIRRKPDLPLISHLLQLIQGHTEVFPGQPNNIISPACPRDLSRGLLPGGAQEASLSDTKTTSNGSFQCLVVAPLWALAWMNEWMNEWTIPISGALQRKLILVSHYPIRFRKGEKLPYSGQGYRGPTLDPGLWRELEGEWLVAGP